MRLSHGGSAFLFTQLAKDVQRTTHFVWHENRTIYIKETGCRLYRPVLSWQIKSKLEDAFVLES